MNLNSVVQCYSKRGQHFFSKVSSPQEGTPPTPPPDKVSHVEIIKQSI